MRLALTEADSDKFRKNVDTFSIGEGSDAIVESIPVNVHERKTYYGGLNIFCACPPAIHGLGMLPCASGYEGASNSSNGVCETSRINGRVYAYYTGGMP